MTKYQLACSVTVIKNMLATRKLPLAPAINALWDLINEATPDKDAHYVLGMSKAVDKLLKQYAPDDFNPTV